MFKSPDGTGCEGDQKEKINGVLCGRPGCYERVLPTSRSPGKKYCSCGCSLAMRRVLERERRWRELLARGGRAVAYIVTDSSVP